MGLLVGVGVGVGVGGSRPWSPRRLSGYVARYSASSSSIVGLGDGAAIPTWAEFQGGVSALQTTTIRKPAVLLNGIGGKPSVRFAGSQYMNISAALTSTTAAIYAVVKYNSTTGQQAFFSDGYTNGLACSINGSGASGKYTGWVKGIAFCEGGTASTSARNMIYASTSGATKIWIAGSPLTLTSATSSMLAPNANAGVYCTIGADSSALTAPAQCDISELVVCTVMPTAADLATWSAWVQATYGV